jgi:V8-like Glu-specific endopeptidase
LESLKDRDPHLYEELKIRLKSRITPGAGSGFEAMAVSESVPTDPEGRPVDFDREAAALETIVREGRPAVLVRNNKIDFESTTPDMTSEVVIERLRNAAEKVEAVIPLIGRIDVDNYPSSLTYVGTGWLVDRDLIVTNRHVAELIARANDGRYSFRSGRFGEPMHVTLDYRHEYQVAAAEVAPITGVLWIEPDDHKADIAFLKIESRNDGTRQHSIPLAEKNEDSSNVAVIGYPARAPAHIIPDQAWMERIYGSTYDVKRVAPGLTGPLSRGWYTHDCTTLGGASGSPVINMDTGEAVALHFAGLYLVENYGVPASTIKEYLNKRPWHPEAPARVVGVDGAGKTLPTPRRQTPEGGAPPQPPAGQTTPVAADLSAGQVSITIPLNITVSLGTPQVPNAAGSLPHTSLPADGPERAAPRDIEEAARALRREHPAEGVYSVWAGYEIEEGSLTDAECLVVSAHPERVEAVRAALPKTYGRFPVAVRPAPLTEQLEASGVITEAPPATISYNDADRTGEGFSFDWVEEKMKARLHVGPERSWTELSAFLGRAKGELISSIYEFHAAHIALAVEADLDKGAKMTLVMARQSSDPKSGKLPKGDFSRARTFEKWERSFGSRFERVFVPLGAHGLVANSYHIKVTVRDRSEFWLSSGNWKGSSQPLIPAESLDNPKVTGAAGNREWHAVIVNDTLSKRFRNHIKEDFTQSLKLGGTLETVEDEVLIDVPSSVLEAVEEEAPPSKVFEPLEFDRVVRVKPLLTPDRKGAIYTQAVLWLIRSAKKQLLFQNQYIKMSGADTGFFKQLVDALVEKAHELDDCRLILRRENDELCFDVSQLKRRGVDIDRQVRVLPKTHTKGIVVDGRRVLLGSHNWSASGVTLNRDASLIFDDVDVAQYFAEVFEVDWNRARPYRCEGAVREPVRTADDEAPPAGYERVSLSDYLEG